jgi:hypothetical protein
VEAWTPRPPHPACVSRRSTGAKSQPPVGATSRMIRAVEQIRLERTETLGRERGLAAATLPARVTVPDGPSLSLLEDQMRAIPVMAWVAGPHPATGMTRKHRDRGEQDALPRCGRHPSPDRSDSRMVRIGARSPGYGGRAVPSIRDCAPSRIRSRWCTLWSARPPLPARERRCPSVAPLSSRSRIPAVSISPSGTARNMR